MRVGFGICKDCGDAGRLKYGARRSRVMRSGSNMGPGGQGEGGAQWAWYFVIPLVLGLLNSLTEGASPRKSMAPTKLRPRECTFSVVVTE